MILNINISFTFWIDLLTWQNSDPHEQWTCWCEPSPSISCRCKTSHISGASLSLRASGACSVVTLSLFLWRNPTSVSPSMFPSLFLSSRGRLTSRHNSRCLVTVLNTCLLRDGRLASACAALQFSSAPPLQTLLSPAGFFMPVIMLLSSGGETCLTAVGGRGPVAPSNISPLFLLSVVVGLSFSSSSSSSVAFLSLKPTFISLCTERICLSSFSRGTPS